MEEKDNAPATRDRYRKGNSSWRRTAAVVGVLLLLIAAIAVTALVIVFLGDSDRVVSVTLNSGEVRGKLKRAPQGGEVEEYLGIPYAHPPTGWRRFRPAETIETLPSDPFDAFRYGASCLQLAGKDSKTSEDCLYVNVWTPRTTETLIPVLVVIAGDDFSTGNASAAKYDGKTLAKYGDVIVVSFNYRLGALGFLSTGDYRIPGNYGVEDQYMALRWVKDNINRFNGDASKVTLLGVGHAGAASVGYHYLYSPKAYPLFRSVILHGGAPQAEWAYQFPDEVSENTEAILDRAACLNSAVTLECLQQAPVEVFMSYQEQQLVNYGGERFVNVSHKWAPAIDTEFITMDPLNVTMSGKLFSKEILVIVNEHEGFYEAFRQLKNLGWDSDDIDDEDYDDITALIFDNLSPSLWDEIQELYRPSNAEQATLHRDALFQLFSDYAYNCPAISLADAVSRQNEGNVYFAQFSGRSLMDSLPMFLGATRGNDVQWVFGHALEATNNYPLTEISFTRRVMDYWVNFIHSGNPNGNGLDIWTPYDVPTRAYLDMLSSDNIRTNTARIRNIFDNFCSTWNGIREQQYLGIL